MRYREWLWMGALFGVLCLGLGVPFSVSAQDIFDEPEQEETIDDVTKGINEDEAPAPAQDAAAPPAEPVKKQRMFKKADGTLITEEQMLAEKAAAEAARAGASPAGADGETKVTLDPQIFGKGWYISLWKILLVLGLYLLWTYSTDWLSTDALKFKLGVGFWVPLVYGVFVGGLFLFWLIPIFWVGFPLLILAYAIPLGFYIVPRNHAVSDADQVLTWGHLRFLFSELMALMGVKIAAPKDPFETGWPVVLYSFSEDKTEAQQRIIRAHAAPGFQHLREILSDSMERWPDAIMCDFSGSGVATKFQVDGVWDAGKRFEGAKSNPALMALKYLLGMDKESLKEQAKRDRKAGKQASAEETDTDADTSEVKTPSRMTGMFRMVYNYSYTFPEDRLRIKEAQDKADAVPKKEKAAWKDAQRELQVARESVRKPEARRREVMVNVSVQAGKSAERFLLQFEGEKAKLPNLDAAGMPAAQQEELKQMTNRKKGVFLISAPPSGGLRTTTKLVLGKMDRFIREVFEVCDGVHKYDEVENIQRLTCTARDVDTWENFVRLEVFFKEPDVIICRDIPYPDITDQFLREIDEENRLLITTNRAKDSAEAILRFLMTHCDIEKAVEHLQGVLCIRLARRLCPHCREPYKPGADLVEQLGLHVDEEETMTFYRPPTPSPGKKKRERCTECQGIGYKGRFGIFELVTIGDTTRRVLLSGKPTLDLVRKALRKDGNKLFMQRGAEQVAAGITSLAELKRVMTPPKKGESSENNGSGSGEE